MEGNSVEPILLSLVATKEILYNVSMGESLPHMCLG